MLYPTPTASEEDSVSRITHLDPYLPPLTPYFLEDPEWPTLLTAHAIASMVARDPQARQQEWSLAMTFTDAYIHVTSLILGCGHECPILLTEQMIQGFEDAHRMGATCLIDVRYHPHEWVGFKLGARSRFHAMRVAAKEAGVPLLEQIITDKHGMVFPFWHQGGAF